jgi:hypothetical protein
LHTPTPHCAVPLANGLKRKGAGFHSVMLYPTLW